MNLTISGHHLDLTAPIREYAQDKMKRLERHFDHLLNAQVILSVEKERQKAEATVHCSGATLHAEATHPDLYAAIDLLADKLDQQTRKHKSKRRDHHANEVVHHQHHQAAA
ncbi:MAG: ribosome-associated translation inhibitor RaiA [Stagnimonas sp.]|nr:ribosome-associated translation inhibitor RaiA [Stagnimonas sp.]